MKKAWGAGLLVLACATGVVVFAGARLNDAPADPRPAGPVQAGGTASCVMDYSPRNLAALAFAFDGTVISIGPGHSDRGASSLGLVGTTFRVNEWFVGGSGRTVTIDLPPPGARDAGEEVPSAYGIGSRLLVSGAHRWGGATMEDAIAWGCGFTRFYDPATADSWGAATEVG